MNNWTHNQIADLYRRMLAVRLEIKENDWKALRPWDSRITDFAHERSSKVQSLRAHPQAPLSEKEMNTAIAQSITEGIQEFSKKRRKRSQ